MAAGDRTPAQLPCASPTGGPAPAPWPRRGSSAGSGWPGPAGPSSSRTGCRSGPASRRRSGPPRRDGGHRRARRASGRYGRRSSWSPNARRGWRRVPAAGRSPGQTCCRRSRGCRLPGRGSPAHRGPRPGATGWRASRRRSGGCSGSGGIARPPDRRGRRRCGRSPIGAIAGSPAPSSGRRLPPRSGPGHPG